MQEDRLEKTAKMKSKIQKTREKIEYQHPCFIIPVWDKKIYPSTRFVILIPLIGIPASIVLALLFGLIIVLLLTNWVLFLRIAAFVLLALVFYKIIKLIFEKK